MTTSIEDLNLTVELDDNASFASSPLIEGGPIHDQLPHNDLECVVCGVQLEYNGRGRKPKFCTVHRGSKSSIPTARSTSNADPSDTPAIKRIKIEIAGTSRSFAGALQWFEPFDAAVLGNNSFRIGETVGNVAARNPKFKASVEKFLKASSYPELLFLMIAILQPILIHHGVIPVNSEMKATMEANIKAEYAELISKSGLGF